MIPDNEVTANPALGVVLPLERFMRRVVKIPDGCWQWQGQLDNGYGRFWVDGKSMLSHRVSYQIHIGEIPKSLQIDHLCRNRGCVNPEHLEPVSIATNVLRGIGISAENARKEWCKRGHPLFGINLYLPKGGARCCKICAVHRTRKWRAAR